VTVRATRLGCDALPGAIDMTEGVMSRDSAKKLLAVLERVLNDALTHECERVIVTRVTSGYRFETELGASLAFLPQGATTWQDVLDLLIRLNDDATGHGCVDCVTSDDMEHEAQIHIRANSKYFEGKIEAIVQRLGS
jgi:hypothetical protein